MKTTVKGIAAAFAATVLATFGATTPALADTAHAKVAHPVVREHRITSAAAIEGAVKALNLTWHEVEGAGWDLDEARGAYVVTVIPVDGAERTVFVDAVTGAAHEAVASADAIAAAVLASGLTWHDVEGVEWTLDGARDLAVTLFTTKGAEVTCVVDAATGAVRTAA